MEPSLLALILLGSLLLFMGLGVPVAFALGGLSLGIGYFLWGGTAGFYAVTLGSLGKLTSFTLTSIPLFLMMAAVLRFSGLADDMYEMINRWMGKLRGGLAIGTVIISAIFAAMVGISTVATATLGLTALPSMLNRGYNKKLAAGAICAGGALGIIIPPSVIMIIYASEAEVSAGQMFFGGILPGILMAVLFIAYIAYKCIKNPADGPPSEENYTFAQKMESAKSVGLPMFIILLVLGVIYLGIATPTEAAGIGLVGSIICAFIKHKMNGENLKKMLIMGVGVNSMVFWIIIGAVAYSRLVTMSGVGQWFSSLVTEMDVNRWAILIGMQAIFFILGMFLDPAGIILITGPFFLPVVSALGFDPLWYGILFVINMCMAYVTPPFGFNLFVIRAVAPSGLTISDIYSAIWPFVGIQAITLLAVALFPQLVTWLPNLIVK
ncbi:TRAP transporter, DctM subunit [Desulfotomaculum arcticum]|uniref:TRAP transporter, DctM subunit n=1 Tax=Desulfotruncus arcticus DSM 17038 TaxID=1121424 RepID=A0A1I2XR07_9FIRM|nr:TRAP transporter large permease subunit [Desulfotruncus arcticus]SFH15805.1 TRAP transporter, DctM subunit [Desulfotomaculum arcticum] [Desulfotruncus arcticus DSM 17038]